MSRFLPEQLAAWAHGRWTGPAPRGVGGFSADSRVLRPGQLFVALRTGKRDGHEFVEAARQAGAAGALVGRPLPEIDCPQLVVADPLAALQAIAAGHRRTFPGPVVGVTGSCGKTSTKDLLTQLLGPEATLATEGNLNNFLGVPLTLTRLDGERHRFGVVEAGISEAGEMAGLARMIQPSHGIVTLIAPAHLEKLGSLEAVAREKAVLLKQVGEAGLAVFPAQACRFAPFQELAERSVVVAPVDSPAAVRGRRTVYFRAETDREGIALSVRENALPERHYRLHSHSLGMAQNAVLALVMAAELGVSQARLESVLASWRPGRWRGEIVSAGGKTFYADCYNASPASMADALQAFAQVAPEAESRLYILGCMEELGAESAEWHRRLGGEVRLRAVDCVWVLGEQAGEIAEGLIQAGAGEHQVRRFSSAEQAGQGLEGYCGSIFVKGSRRYALESLLPAAPSSSGHPLAC